MLNLEDCLCIWMFAYGLKFILGKYAYKLNVLFIIFVNLGK